MTVKKKNAPRVDGGTTLVAIFGWPLQYTLSPAFQNVALTWAGKNSQYVPLAAKTPGEFRSLARGLMASPHFLGANITNPYKVEALKLAFSATPAAKAIGAANTLYRQGGRWMAHNTDAGGFLQAAKTAGIRLKGAKVLVLGAGGAARAIVWSLGQSGADEIGVLARRPSQAKDCAKTGGKRAFGHTLSAQAIAAASQAADVVVNTLPGGALGADVARALAPAQGKVWAVDISYLPRSGTGFLKEAQRRGWRTLDGLPMLLEQGRLAFQCWIGRKPPLKLLEKALRKV
jgi:shikimate dehydrogenase